MGSEAYARKWCLRQEMKNRKGAWLELLTYLPRNRPIIFLNLPEATQREASEPAPRAGPDRRSHWLAT